MQKCLWCCVFDKVKNNAKMQCFVFYFVKNIAIACAKIHFCIRPFLHQIDFCFAVQKSIFAKHHILFYKMFSIRHRIKSYTLYTWDCYLLSIK